MIRCDDIVNDFKRFLDEKRGYIPNTAGELWTQSKQDRFAQENEMIRKYGQQWVGRKVDDCSGAFVDSYNLHGENIYHGSNRIVRVYVEQLLPISKAKPGYAAFKLHKPGEDGYSLPSEYKSGGKYYNGDLNDYYHIGLVGADGKRVINAQSTSKGFTNTDLSQWACVAKLKAVQYDDIEGGDEPMDDMPLYIAKVTAESGKTVNMRRNPSMNASVLKAIPIGEEVEVMDVLDGWSKISYNGQDGYMMSKFLVPIGGESDNPVVPSESNNIRDELEALKVSLETALSIIDKLLVEG